MIDWLIRVLGGYTKDDLRISVEENCKLRGEVFWKSVKEHGMPETSHNKIVLWDGKSQRFGRCLGRITGAQVYGDGKSFYTPFDEPLRGITHYVILPIIKDVEKE